MIAHFRALEDLFPVDQTFTNVPVTIFCGTFLESPIMPVYILMVCVSMSWRNMKCMQLISVKRYGKYPKILYTKNSNKLACADPDQIAPEGAI